MKILIIEDDLAIRSNLQDLLEIHSHTVLAAADGPTGIRLAADGPDLIFCDMVMPGMNGDEVIAAIRQFPCCLDTPFVFLTALSNRADQRFGMLLGADDYITKPFTERDIVDAIATRTRRQLPLRQRVEELLAERRTVVGANWSHELLTPMTTVLGGLDLIESEATTIKPDELIELLGIIRHGAVRQLTLSRKLILYFELELLKAGPSGVNGHCPIAETVAAGAIKVAQEMKRFSDLAVCCDPGTAPLAGCVLSAAITEVVGNALRFSPTGQPVTVSGSCHGHRYVIAITDRGSGMTAVQCAHIGPFIQFGRDKREQQGLGLGLAIARSAATIAGGSLVLTPGDGGVGLRVIFDLPCQGA
jgi:two-component system sensor histidine kinase/response regulator